MSAIIASLHGKYYGTEVHIEHKHGPTMIKVWFMGDGKPSERELFNWDSIEDFNENCCDDHYESADGYEIAFKIAEAFK